MSNRQECERFPLFAVSQRDRHRFGTCKDGLGNRRRHSFQEFLGIGHLLGKRRLNIAWAEFTFLAHRDDDLPRNAGFVDLKSFDLGASRNVLRFNAFSSDVESGADRKVIENEPAVNAVQRPRRRMGCSQILQAK